MCATFGDNTDVLWYTEHNLPYRKVISADGTIDNSVPFIAGLKVASARKEIISLLQEKGLLLKSETLNHTIGIHERCGKPIEIIPSRQWYIDVLTGKDRFLKAADEINWYPESMKVRYTSWVENLKWDWCISRQRYFGIPFPVWYCTDCRKAVFAKIEDLPINPLERTYEGICDCGCVKFIPESAVFDTWATSSITPQINERLGLKLTPMSMRTQAHEIIRTWTFYTIVRSLYHTGDLPWKDIMICGFVLAKKGEKISKSKSNNEFEPNYLINTHSADVLRYWTAGAKLGTDTFFSADELNIPKRFLTKLYNACKFAISHLEDYDNTEEVELMPVDKWIIERTNETIKNCTILLDEYEIGSARHEIDELFWKDFCDNYVEIVKDRLYKPEIHGLLQRKSGQYALYHSLFNILKLYAIYVPHITEYIYQEFFMCHEKEKSIHLLKWENINDIDENILEFGKKLTEVIADMRKFKAANNFSMRAEMPELEIHCGEYEPYFKQNENDIIACTNAKLIIYK